MNKVIYIFFCLSGASGLIYQVVWSRLLLLIFGNTTHSTTTIISVFMAGLAAGSLVFGAIADKNKKLILLWGSIEILIGISAIFMLITLPFISQIYNTHSIFLKYVITAVLIFPATFFMGGTLPILIKLFARGKNPSQEVSTLYFVNTLGAFVGTILSAFVLIEILGLNLTAFLATLINILIGTLAVTFFKNKKIISTKAKPNKSKNFTTTISKSLLILILLVFFLSGAISMSYEIVWTRLLLTSTGTYTYAFATILATILIGVALGSFTSKILFKAQKNPVILFALTEVGIGIFATLSIISLSLNIPLGLYPRLILVLLPASLLSGATFPIISGLFNNPHNFGKNLGGTYAANTTGSIIGPLITGFILIPSIGTTKTTLILSSANILAGSTILLLFYKKLTKSALFISIIPTFIIFLYINKPQAFIEKGLKEKISFYQEKNWSFKYLEDETASILAFSGQSNSPDEKGLIIDGVQTTTLTIQTKLLAHLPLLIHRNPKDMLIIAFGMGTTYRSALIHNINVDAIELVPSVPKVFSMFFKDAEKVLTNPKGNIIINDGRNYTKLTSKKYDVIVVDPPPPINAAGTTVLYSKEFYEDSTRILKEEGILVQWFWYGTHEEDFKMLFSAMRSVFPHILVAVSPDGRGVFFIGSQEEIILKKDFLKEKLNNEILEDLNEWQKSLITLERLLELFVGDEKTIDRFIADTQPVTDNHPKTEYFLIRHKLNPRPNISPNWVHPILPEFDQKHSIERE